MNKSPSGRFWSIGGNRSPSCQVKRSFIPKADIYTQAKSAVRTGQAPDIFYMEPDQHEFVAAHTRR